MKRISSTFGLERVCPFLWGEDSPEAQHSAAQWMYANHAALAYSGYLKQGRGVLAGPFARTADGALLDCSSLKEALFETGEMWTASVTYLPVAEQDFGAAVYPAETRSLLMLALNGYNPELEVPMLLMRNGRPHVFLPSFRSEACSPRYLYETAASSLEPAENEAAGSGSAGNVILPRLEQSRSSHWRRQSEKFKPTFVPLTVG